MVANTGHGASWLPLDMFTHGSVIEDRQGSHLGILGTAPLGRLSGSLASNSSSGIKPKSIWTLWFQEVKLLWSSGMRV
jgi:hypothetical protein